MNEELLKVIREKGLLLEKEVFDFLSSINTPGAARTFLEYFERFSGQKFIAKSILSKHYEFVQKIVNTLPGSDKESVENTIIKLGLRVELAKERVIIDKSMPNVPKQTEAHRQDYQLFYADTNATKKIGVMDFVNHFRSRYQQMQKILMQRPDLGNLMSIDKISSERQQLAIIGIVKEKRVTKNKNLIITFEDLTGSINVLFKPEREEVFLKANELLLDDVVALKASGSREILFGYDLYYPDAFLTDKTKFNEETCIAFISDIHAGSERHLEKSLNRFLHWISSDDPIAKKIKYLFIVGDNTDGVGVFPGQEQLLTLKTLGQQYELLASYLKRIPSRITMFLIPGQHDASRVAEPQPVVDRKYAEPLYHIPNLVLTTNPTLVKLKEGEKEFKVLMYHGASIHSFINEIPELREMKAHKSPAKAVKHMLKRRHLAPVHSSAVYVPFADKDPMVISEVPDVLCTGEVHRLDIETYNGVLIITGSCWQAQTPFEEKVGNIPDPCKVPVLNLKTRELKIFDFGDEEELKRWG